MKNRTILVVGLMLLSMLALMGLPNASAADKNYLRVDEWHGSMFDRYVNNGAPFYLGDDDITFNIAVKNRVYEFAPVEYQIWNITAEIGSQKDSNGNSVNILDFSDGEKERDYDPIVSWSSVSITGFQADVVTDGKAGTYNLTVKFDYEYNYYDNSDPPVLRTGTGTDTDSVLIRIEDGVTIGTDVKVFNEYDSIVGHYLYAGTTFQKVGIYVQTDVGKIGAVTATVTLDAQTKSYITLDNVVAKTSQVSPGGYVYFKYRVDVKDGTTPGRYYATLNVQYERWYGEDDQTTIHATSLRIEFIVDFTPLLTISSGESFTVAQGAITTDLTGVTLENIGNTALKKTRVWIDIWNYFEENALYYDGDGGNKVLLPTEEEKEEMGKGETWQVDFLGVNIFKYLPAGEHRLPLSYEGYYEDDGSAGGSSDYKLTDDSVYFAVKGEQIYIKIIVTDSTHDFKVESHTSLNLGTRMNDVDVTFSVTNKEEVGILYTEIRLGTKDGTNQLLINPEDPTSDYLELIEIPRFGAQATKTFTVNADIVQEANEGFYHLPVSISGLNANTKMSITPPADLTLTIRVNPEPPRLIVTDIMYPVKISAGKEFDLQITVQNDGKDAARDVFVTLMESQRDSDVTVTTDFTPDVAKAEGALEPFSTEISKIFVGDIDADSSIIVNYTVKVDVNIVKGRNYEMLVTVEYGDDLNRAWTYNTEVSIFAKGSQPEPEKDYTPVKQSVTSGFLIVIIIFIFAIIFMVVMGGRRRRGPPGMMAEPIAEPMDDDPTIRESSPPPGGGAADDGKAQTFKVCPACHKSVQSSNVNCPHCGCAL